MNLHISNKRVFAEFQSNDTHFKVIKIKSKINKKKKTNYKR